MDIFKSNIVVGVAAGLTATLLAPVLVPAVAMAARPLAKSLLKGGVVLYEKGREALAGVGEEVEDMIAEVRSEMEQRPEESTPYSQQGDDSTVRQSVTGYAGDAAAGVQDVSREDDNGAKG
jgi:hypothetical protein